MKRHVELLLTENVGNTGIVGDVVNVKPGFARNYLLPRGLATTPTKGAIARLAERRKQAEAEMAKQREQLESMLETLQGREITVQRSHNEQGVLFGGVSQHDIAEALREEGFEVDDRAVRIGQTIKRLDSYDIPLVLAPDLKTQIKLWVVSDRPADELDAELDVKGEGRESQLEAWEAEQSEEIAAPDETAVAEGAESSPGESTGTSTEPART